MLKIIDRIALKLWRDRYDYDPAIGGPSQHHNVSAWTRIRPARQKLARAMSSPALWLAFLAGVFTLAAALLPHYLGRTEAEQQMKAVARELRLKCVREPEDILLCREVATGDHDVVTGANADGNDALNATAKNGTQK